MSAPVDRPRAGHPRGGLRASRDAGRKLLVPYLTGGLDDEWLLVLEALAGAGADAIEVGIPFSDPMIDGSVIQESSLRALQRGTTPDGVLADLSRVDVGVPLVAMTYYNLIYRAGHERIAGSMQQSGVRGAIIPDLPLEEVGSWAAAADAQDVATVLLVAPSTPDERIAAICERARGFVYAVGRMGVTGEQAVLADSAREVGRAHQGPHRPARSASASACPRRSRPRPSARWPTAWSWARHWCAACSRAPGPRGRRTSSDRSGRPSTAAERRPGTVTPVGPWARVPLHRTGSTRATGGGCP